MIENRSVLHFERYVVSKIDFEMNESFSEKDSIRLAFDFDSNMVVDENSMIIELSAVVFPNAIKNDFPFEMKVGMKGYFSIDSSELQGKIELFESNAIAIMFPYLRSLISTFTANANIAPVLLPAMNINEYLRKKNSN